MKNGRCKEYKNGELIFDGYYLNDKRWNGKRKESDYNDNLIFEGEYVNNKKKGKYKKYNENRELRSEGEYLYDFKYKGKEYIKGKLVYEGNYLYDKKYTGKSYDENGNIIYELIKGNGKVIEYSNNNKTFDGELLNGKKNGRYKGILIFDGEYLNEIKNGKCKEYSNYGEQLFDGEYIYGKKTENVKNLVIMVD